MGPPHSTSGRYYQGYVSFFSKQISENGAATTLEKFIFSDKYNFQEGRDASTQPEMLARLYAGVVHPLIHVGYGLEFGLKGMLVEGTWHQVLHKDGNPSRAFKASRKRQFMMCVSGDLISLPSLLQVWRAESNTSQTAFRLWC